MKEEDEFDAPEPSILRPSIRTQATRKFKKHSVANLAGTDQEELRLVSSNTRAHAHTRTRAHAHTRTRANARTRERERAHAHHPAFAHARIHACTRTPPPTHPPTHPPTRWFVEDFKGARAEVILWYNIVTTAQLQVRCRRSHHQPYHPYLPPPLLPCYCLATTTLLLYCRRAANTTRARAHAS